MAQQSLEDTAAQLCRPGWGLLAADESTGTIGKRLEKAGFVNDEVGCHGSVREPACLPDLACCCFEPGES